MAKQIVEKVSRSQRGLWEYRVEIIFLKKKMIAFSRRRGCSSCIAPLPRVFPIPSERAVCLHSGGHNARGALSCHTRLVYCSDFGILPPRVRERIKTESNYLSVVKQLCLSPLDLKCSSIPKKHLTHKKRTSAPPC